MLPRDVADALERADRQRLELAGIGCFSQVFKIPDTDLVIKRAEDHPLTGNLEPSEKRIYQRLGHHPRILRYYGEYRQGNGLPEGLVFQYHGSGTLTDNLDLSKYQKQRLQ
jgi:serine/threonine protein kinase